MTVTVTLIMQHAHRTLGGRWAEPAHLLPFDTDLNMHSFNMVESSDEYETDLPDEERSESLPLTILNRKQGLSDDELTVRDRLHQKQEQDRQHIVHWKSLKPGKNIKKSWLASLSLTVNYVRTRRHIACGLVLLCVMFVLATCMRRRSRDLADASEAQAKNQPSFFPFDYSPVPFLFAASRHFPQRDDESYSAARIREEFNRARGELMETLEIQYGTAYLQQLLRSLALKSPSVAMQAGSASDGGAEGGGLGWERMRRKIAKKLLAVQLRVADGDESSRNAMKMEAFVWATGGHSAAAGHGNMYNESYTAILQNTVRDAFSKAGIWFEARNYAMGGTPSGPEVALCQPEIFGTDVDVLSWDYGMTDGRTPSLLELYCSRAGVHTNRPACVGVEVQGGGGAEKLTVLRHLEESGMTVLYLDDAVKAAALGALPDCAFLPEDELDSLPRFIRHFKCDGEIERGHPFCESDKFTDVSGYCPSKPKFRTGWHPGWKWHALVGRLLGLSMLQLLDEALSSLENLSVRDMRARYDSVKGQDDADFRNFKQSDLSQHWGGLVASGEQDESLNLETLFRDRAMCHTAFLPSESRYKGIMMMNSSMGGFRDYYKGVSRQDADAQVTTESPSPRLVYDSSDRQGCDVLEVDYKDYYYLTEAEGWKQWTLPNKAELATYAPNGETLKGLVAFALKPCRWGKPCLPEDVRDDGLEAGLLEMQVNRVAVTQLTKVMGVRFLKHKDGHVFPHNGTGQFEIRARVTAQGKYFRPTSFMLL